MISARARPSPVPGTASARSMCGEVVAGQLQTALTSRIAIEQAKGVLAERLQISTDHAFAMLRAAARSHNRPAV